LAVTLSVLQWSIAAWFHEQKIFSNIIIAVPKSSSKTRHTCAEGITGIILVFATQDGSSKHKNKIINWLHKKQTK